MSHEIRQHDKQQGREMAWHGLTDVQPMLTLETCWLNSWDYQPKKVKTEDGQDTPFYVLGVNDVESLYIGTPYAPDTFKPILNKKLIELLTKGTEGKDLVLASCGSIKDRGCQFFSFQLGESYKAAGREFVPYFNIGNGNDKSSPLWQNTSSTATVCSNTFNFNMLHAGIIMEVKKTKFSELRIGDFGKAMKAMLAGQKEFAEMLENLAKIECNEEESKEFFAGFLGDIDKPLSTRSENVISQLVNLFKTGKGNEGKNYADMFQAMTDYYTHESAGGDDKWRQFVSSEFGAGNNAKMRAWTILNNEKQRLGMLAIGKQVLKITAEKAKKEQAA